MKRQVLEETMKKNIYFLRVEIDEESPYFYFCTLTFQ